MPIYAYRCSSCGHAKDALQKISDSPLTRCPACGAESFVKQLTAAGFQLKGSGWYVTDFRGGNNAPAADAKTDEAKAKADDKSDTKTDAKTQAKTDARPAADAGAAPATKASDTSTSSSAAPSS